MIEDIAFDWMPSIIENFVMLYFMAYYLGFKDHIAIKYRRISLCGFTAFLCLASYMGTYFADFEILFMILAIIICILYGLFFLTGSLVSTVFTSMVPFVFIVVINSVSLYIFSIIKY